jgi:HK97 family phage portal protein
MAAGVPINDDAAMSISVVFTCIAILADAISTLPLQQLVKTGDRSRVPVDPAPLLVQPWPDCTLQQWLFQLMYSLLLRGNVYGMITSRDGDGYPSSIQLIHPDLVVPRRNRLGQREYRINGDLVNTQDVMHIPAMTPPGAFIGLNPVEYMRGSWGLASATEKFGGKFFENSAQPSGIIQAPGDLNPNEARELVREWRQTHGGIGNAQYPAVLTGGLEWKQLSINPDDAQFLATRTFQAADIANFFRVPQHLALGNADKTTSYGIGIESMELQFITYTLGPWLARIENQFTAYTPPGYYAQFDLSRRIRGPSLERAQRHTLELNGGWKNADMIAAEEDMAPLPNGVGQTFWRPLNFAPADSPQFTDPALSSGGPGGGIQNHPDAPPAPSPPGKQQKSLDEFDPVAYAMSVNGNGGAPHVDDGN